MFDRIAWPWRLVGPGGLQQQYPTRVWKQIQLKMIGVRQQRGEVGQYGIKVVNGLAAVQPEGRDALQGELGDHAECTQ
ncbi:Uncharacterised protein [Mycobacteroides abscessus subsp. abscessus]|nr:Uncharacterised protein [Mycobacteroides abscessus subsp. abscessus]